MILHYVKQWEKRKHILEQWLIENEPNSYEHLYFKLFKLVVIEPESRFYKEWDWSRHRVIDDGDFQGNIIFVLCNDSYQPDLHDYIFTSVAYGSCSGCDTFQALDEVSKEERVKGYMTLALHMVQATESFNTKEK